MNQLRNVVHYLYTLLGRWAGGWWAAQWWMASSN